MDETFDKPIDKQPKGSFVVGGLLGRGEAFFELERRWEKLRKRPDIDIKYFKASDCQAGEKETAKFVADPRNKTKDEIAKLDSISHEFLNLIAHPVPLDDRPYIVVHGVGVLQEEFYDIIKDSKAHDILGSSPYCLAHDLAMVQCAWAMKQLGDSYGVSFVCDEDGEHSHFAEERYGNLKRNNPVAAKYMGSFASRDDKKCEALQAADAAAFEVRRALNLSLKMWEGELRRQPQSMHSRRRPTCTTVSKKCCLPGPRLILRLCNRQSKRRCRLRWVNDWRMPKPQRSKPSGNGVLPMISGNDTLSRRLKSFIPHPRWAKRRND
jgi:hypothetical protein